MFDVLGSLGGSKRLPIYVTYSLPYAVITTARASRARFLVASHQAFLILGKGRAFAALVVIFPIGAISRKGGWVGRRRVGGVDLGAAKRCGITPPTFKIKIGRGGCDRREIGRDFLYAISAYRPYRRLEIAPEQSATRVRCPRLFAIGERRDCHVE